MSDEIRYTLRISLIVALGGFLMGFDASVISGVVGFIETEFSLNNIELGWAVASLTLTATLGMMVAGPLSDRIGRRPVLMIAAMLFAVSAVLSACAPTFTWLIAGRMLGGLGVGAALIIAPMYIAEVSPARVRGRMVSVNQLNIVVGISAAFFSNYLILKLGQSGVDWAASAGLATNPWRWMLGVEVIPALLFLLALFAVPESPRWLMMHGGDPSTARRLMLRAGGAAQGAADFDLLQESLQHEQAGGAPKISELFSPAMRPVLTIGLIVSVLQQLTGINAVFFYAPMIFEKSGIGTDASFMQAVLVGLVNLVFTVLAIAFVDRLGRRPLLLFGLAGIALSMAVLAYGFSGGADQVNAMLVLIGTLSFVASFAISIGPVMWVLFAELFPNRLRGLAVSLVGLINSAVSFLIQLVFPWELENFGSSVTFIIYGVFATVGLLLVLRLFPETKGRSLEEIERELVAARPAAGRP